MANILLGNGGIYRDEYQWPKASDLVPNQFMIYIQKFSKIRQRYMKCNRKILTNICRQYQTLIDIAQVTEETIYQKINWSMQDFQTWHYGLHGLLLEEVT